MLPSNLSEVAFTNTSEATYVQRIVGGEVRFPSHSKSCFLLYGKYGSGKTTLAHMLPTLLEHQNAETSERQDNDWQYNYRSDATSVTPANTGKPALLPANFNTIDCGSHHSNAAISIIQDIEKKSRSDLSMVLRAGRFNHFLIDELDCWGEPAQAKLKGLITSAPIWNVFYITTNSKGKIDEGIISRSIKLELNGRDLKFYLESVKKHFPHIASYSDNQLCEIINACDCDWRQVEDMMNRL